MLLTTIVLILLEIMALVCPFCLAPFPNSRGLAVHTSSCPKAQHKLRNGIASRKRKQQDEKGRDIPVKSRKVQVERTKCPGGPNAPIMETQNQDSVSEEVCPSQSILKKKSDHSRY